MAAGDKTVKDLGYLSKNQGMAAAMPRHTGSSATAHRLQVLFDPTSDDPSN